MVTHPQMEKRMTDEEMEEMVTTMGPYAGPYGIPVPSSTPKEKTITAKQNESGGWDTPSIVTGKPFAASDSL